MAIINTLTVLKAIIDIIFTIRPLLKRLVTKRLGVLQCHARAYRAKSSA